MSDPKTVQVVNKGQTVRVCQKFVSGALNGTVTKVLKSHFEVNVPALGDDYVIRVLWTTMETKFGAFKVFVPESDAPLPEPQNKEQPRWTPPELLS
jgi:hypothetical protein